MERIHRDQDCDCKTASPDFHEIVWRIQEGESLEGIPQDLLEEARDAVPDGSEVHTVIHDQLQLVTMYA